MRCSICKSLLVKGGQERLETIDEHICCPNEPPKMKDKFVCSNSRCASSLANSCWNEIGDYYGDYVWSKKFQFIDNLKSAFDSLARQLEVEIYKEDENYTWFIVPSWFPIRKGWKCKVEYSYEANEKGEILKRKRQYKWVTSDNVYHIGNFRMLKFSLKRLWKSRKYNYRENLEKNIKHSKWPKAELWRRIMGKISVILLKFYKGK